MKDSDSVVFGGYKLFRESFLTQDNIINVCTITMVLSDHEWGKFDRISELPFINNS